MEAYDGSFNPQYELPSMAERASGTATVLPNSSSPICFPWCFVLHLTFGMCVTNCSVLVSVKNGPPQYCSRTVYEDAPPELLRDFFWDDDFRLKWDNMLTHASILEECPTTGIMVVRWIRKVGNNIFLFPSLRCCGLFYLHFS